MEQKLLVVSSGSVAALEHCFTWRKTSGSVFWQCGDSRTLFYMKQNASGSVQALEHCFILSNRLLVLSSGSVAALEHCFT
jgi:hypothetical protein